MQFCAIYATSGRKQADVKNMAIDSEWEKFLGGPTKPPQQRLYATINRANRILFNDRIYRGLGKPEAVDLYFNRERDQIALQPTIARLETAFPVRGRGVGSREIYAGPFCQHYGIRIDATYRFIDPEISPDGRLILKLSQAVIVKRRPKRKRKAD